MIFDGKPIDEIKDDEFDSLVQERISERQHLEFKETYDIKNNDDKLEILRDIASLANAGGGYLIIGIQDDGTGKPVGYRSLTEENLAKMKQSIQQLCLDHIAERIPRLELRIRRPSNHPILVIQIPDSSQAPHMVKFNRRTDFYSRYDQGKREMSIAEVRRAFQGDRVQLALDLMSRQINEIRGILPEMGSEILGNLPGKKTSKTGTVPFFPCSYTDGNRLVQFAYEKVRGEINGKPYFWIAATPMLLNKNALDIDSPEIRQVINAPPGSRPSGWNMELSATINNIPDGIERGSKEFEYLALYRNAHMEFWTPLRERFCWTQKVEEFKKRPELYPYPVVEYPVTFLRLYKAVSELPGFQGNFIINLCYLNLRGYRLRPYAPKQVGYMFADELKPFDYDNLILPPLRKAYPFDPDKTGYELLVQVYEAFGLSSKMIPFYETRSFKFP
jgi:hypothetical protein